MLSTYNDDSTTSNSTKAASNKIKILSQTLLKAANLSSKKDWLNQALEASDSNKSVETDPGSKVISKQLFQNDKDGKKPNASKRKSSKEATVPNTVNVRKRKEKKRNTSYNISSSESESDNEKVDKKSSLKHKKPTVNSQISRPNEKKHDTSKREVISSSTSDSETEIKSTDKRDKKSDSEESSSETSRNSSNSRRNDSTQKKSTSQSSNSTQRSSSSRSKSRSPVYSSSSESDSSKDIKTNKKRSCSSESSSSDSEDNKKGKETPSSFSKLKRKYSDMKSSDDSSDNDSKINKKRKQASTTPVKSEVDKLLDNFVSENQYKLVEPKQLTSLDTLDKHEEVYLLQLSKTIDPLLLIGKTISFDGPSKLKIGGKSYTSDVSTKDQYDINVINFTNLVNLKPKGVITFQPRIKSVNSNFEMKPVNDILEIPDNLKVRHPLFGTDYKKRIKLDKDIENKLNEIVGNIDKKRKKKSKKDCDNISNEIQNEADSIPKKKKKKKKHQDSIELSEQITSTDNILNQGERKHCSKEFIFNVPDIIQETCKKEKKNKKDKKKDETKKRHMKNIVNSTMLTSEKSNSFLQLDESCIPKAEKKRHKHKHDIETENFIDDLVKDVNASQETTPHKKKKHKKKHSIE